MQKYIRIHSDDTVAVALAPLKKNEQIQLGSYSFSLPEKGILRNLTEYLLV